VGLQVGLSLEGVEHRFDPLADAAQLAEAGGFIRAVRPHEVRAELVGDERFELLAGEAFVAEQDLADAHEVVVGFQQGGHHLAFAEFGVGQSPDDG
jgi:hypothetical protein